MVTWRGRGLKFGVFVWLYFWMVPLDSRNLVSQIPAYHYPIMLLSSPGGDKPNLCYKIITSWNVSVLQIRAGQRSITTNLWSLTTHIYHVMIIVTSGFSKKSFFIIIFRSSHTQMFFKTDIIKNFAIFTGKHLCWSLFIEPWTLRSAFGKCQPNANIYRVKVVTSFQS